MESNYWQRYWTTARAQKPTTPKRHRRTGAWLPSTIGKGESQMNYWQRQEAFREGQLGRIGRRAA